MLSEPSALFTSCVYALDVSMIWDFDDEAPFVAMGGD